MQAPMEHSPSPYFVRCRWRVWATPDPDVVDRVIPLRFVGSEGFQLVMTLHITRHHACLVASPPIEELQDIDLWWPRPVGEFVIVVLNASIQPECGPCADTVRKFGTHLDIHFHNPPLAGIRPLSVSSPKTSSLWTQNAQKGLGSARIPLPAIEGALLQNNRFAEASRIVGNRFET